MILTFIGLYLLLGMGAAKTSFTLYRIGVMDKKQIKITKSIKLWFVLLWPGILLIFSFL